ncbi:phage tail length tape measure family protein [Sinorhizobium fredii]|uniref:phage tail length tape measure family protein n=1 Tax=Rhizobium fredii TaxID=380 RepID=UPI0035118013
MTEAVLGFKIDSSQASTAGADLDRLAASAAKLEQAVEKLEAEAARLGKTVGKAGEEARKALPPVDGLGRSFGTQDQHVKAFRAEVERLTKMFPPLVDAEKKYQAAVNDIQSAHRLGIMSTQQMTQRLDQARMAYERLKTSATTAGAAVKAANTNVARGGGGQNFNSANIAAQLQDIAVTSAMGMSPMQIALQQGTQMAAVLGPMGATGVVSGLGAAFASLVNPVSLATMAFVGAGAAAIQYFSTTGEEARTLEGLLEQQADAVARVRDLWGEAADQRSRYGRDSTAAASFNLENTITALSRRLREGIDDGSIGGAITEAINSNRDLAGLTARQFRGTTLFKQLQVDLGDLHKEALRGSPVVLDLVQKLEAFGQATNNSGLKAMAAEAVAALQPFKQLAEAIREAEIERRRLFDDRGPNGMLLSQGTTNRADMGNLALYESQKQAEKRIAEKRDREAYLNRLLNGGSSGSSDLFGPTTKGANDLSTAITNVEAAYTGVIDVTQSLAMAQFKQLSAMQQSSANLRTAKKDLADISMALKEAANIPPFDIFGDRLTGAAGAKAISEAATNIEKVFAELKNGGLTAAMAHERIEGIRASLKAMGGDAASVDRFVDGMVAGRMEALRLDGVVKQLSQSIMNIPNKMVSIGIQQYTVGSAGGGTKGVNVYGGNADFDYQQYDVGGGKTVGVSGGRGNYSNGNGGFPWPQPSEWDALTPVQRERIYNRTGGTDWYRELYGRDWEPRAAGGPVSAGGTYLVGERGPELLQMGGSGQVTNTNSTASILSGGRDTLSLIEDHAYSTLMELRIQTGYWADMDSDMEEMISCLKALKTASASYSGGSSYAAGSSSSGGSYSRGGSSSGGSSHLDQYSPYYFNAARNFAGRGGGRYDPVADAMLNGNTAALNGVGNGYTNYLRQLEIGGSGSAPSLLDRMKRQLGFATGGQIMPGEDQRVEFFKKRNERVIVVDDSKVSDSRGSQQPAQDMRPIQIINNFNGGNIGDARSRQQMVDEFRRAIKHVVSNP